MSEPERQCVGCGIRGPQNGLIRLTLDRATVPASVVVAQSTRERSGRGAYLCRRQACLDRALRRRAFQRVFRTTLQVDEDEIRAALRTIEAAM